jgi:putative spermidine/putrescine transport system ATP-binding protein
MIEASKTARTLRLDGIAKSYATVVAVHPLSLTVPAGSLVALLGPSGCGKSTTLRIVAGLEEPDQGRVFLDREDITDTPCNRRNLGLVFQNYALFPHMTVADNVSFGLRMSGLDRAAVRARTQDALTLVQLTGLDARFPAMLSGGQQQRVALARTLVMRPAALLLDEPLGALDKNLRESMQFELRRLQRSLGITTVMVTHDQEEALTLSDMVVVMNEGRIVQTGTPQEVYDRPQTRFVAEFLGTANIFACTRGADARAARVALAGGAEVAVPLAADAGRDRFLLAVRPERIVLSPEAAGPFRLRGSVRGAVFRGDNYIYEVEVEGLASAVYAQAQHSRADGRAAVGDAVHLTWAPESGVVLNDPI